MRYGYSSSDGMGVGLPGAKWIVDDFEIVSSLGQGTVVTLTKWLPTPPAPIFGRADAESVLRAAACA